MTEKLLMLGFSIFFLLFACVQTSIRIRYFAPIFPPLVLLSMFGLQYIQENIIGQNSRISGFLKRITVFLIIFVMLGLNAKYLIERFSFVQPVDYLTDKVTRDDYIQKYRPEFACLQYANRNLNKSHRILGLYIGNRAYYSDIDIMFDLDLLKDLASGADSAEEIYKGLRKKNITHLLINIELFNFYVKKYSLHQKQLLKDFFETYTLQEFERDGNGLLTVVHNP
jgi:hypothetical protein